VQTLWRRRIVAVGDRDAIGDLGAKVREAQKVLRLAARFFDDVQVKTDLLAGYQPTEKQIGRYFRELDPNPDGGNKTRARNTRKRLWQFFEAGRGQEIVGIRHTAWAAYQAVTDLGTTADRPGVVANENGQAGDSNLSGSDQDIA